MNLALHHVALNVADRSAASRFYRAAIDLVELDDVAPGVTWLAGANAHLALYPAEAAGGESGFQQVCDTGIAHFCVQSRDGDGLWQRLADNGMDFISRPVALGTGNVYAYGRDPEANLVEAEGVPVADPRTPIWFAHVALVSPNIERSIDFYSRLLGHAPYRTGRFSNPLFSQVTGFDDVEVDAAWFLTGGLQLELWQYRSPKTGARPVRPPQGPGYRHVGWSVTDMAAFRQHLAETGLGATGGDAIGSSQACWMRDPDDNVLAFFSPAGSALDRARLSHPDLVNERVVRPAAA